MKARVAKLKAIDAATPAALETAVNTWLQAAGEKELLEIRYQADGTTWAAFILYTE